MRSTRIVISAAMLGALVPAVLSATTASAASAVPAISRSSLYITDKSTGVKGWVPGMYVDRDVRMRLD